MKVDAGSQINMKSSSGMCVIFHLLLLFFKLEHHSQWYYPQHDSLSCFVRRVLT